ncbi:hypothetical protein HPSH_06025 [Helicobacter pylori Shi470]|nr:hypothetical protein HPSH_06025 [Helicobacter pylori Shi470]AEN18859.1 hypothetical protein HPPN135_05980 [Helicobacter pylori Puno135]
MDRLRTGIKLCFIVFLGFILLSNKAYWL